jgi:N-acetylmuramoyl-L-alanine amidase
VLTVLQNNEGWLEVRLPSGQIGWVSAEFIAHPIRDSAPLPDRSGRPSPVAGRVIVIDPGHGGSNPGAIGVTGLMEKIVNLDVSLRVANLLRSAGATVVMTRSSDIYLNLAPRVVVAENAKADVFVSIHANAHLSPSIGGTETYYYQYKASGNQSRILAQSIQSELVRTLRLRDIGIKQGSFHVIRETSMPSVLVELAFLSNALEESMMRTDTFRENSAAAIFRGLENYFIP